MSQSIEICKNDKKIKKFQKVIDKYWKLNYNSYIKFTSYIFKFV